MRHFDILHMLTGAAGGYVIFFGMTYLSGSTFTLAERALLALKWLGMLAALVIGTFAVWTILGPPGWR
jgi:hypothetical protein